MHHLYAFWVYKQTNYIFESKRKFWTWYRIHAHLGFWVSFYFSFYHNNLKAVFVRVNMNCNFPAPPTNNIIFFFLVKFCMCLIYINLYLLVNMSNISENSLTQPFYKTAFFRILVLDTKDMHHVEHFINLFNFVGSEMVRTLLESLLTRNFKYFKIKTHHWVQNSASDSTYFVDMARVTK